MIERQGDGQIEVYQIFICGCVEQVNPVMGKDYPGSKLKLDERSYTRGNMVAEMVVVPKNSPNFLKTKWPNVLASARLKSSH
jgi:hypothetical protein